MNTQLQKNEENILRRVEHVKKFQKHRDILDRMDNELQKKKNTGIVESNYLKMKKQMKVYKDRNNEFR